MFMWYTILMLGFSHSEISIYITNFMPLLNNKKFPFFVYSLHKISLVQKFMSLNKPHIFCYFLFFCAAEPCLCIFFRQRKKTAIADIYLINKQKQLKKKTT